MICINCKDRDFSPWQKNSYVYVCSHLKRENTDRSKHTNCPFLTHQSDLSLLPGERSPGWYTDKCLSPGKYKRNELLTLSMAK